VLIDVADFGIRDQRGDFEPLIAEHAFYQTQVVPPPGSRHQAEPPGLLRRHLR
jgi:hypothetical protein